MKNSRILIGMGLAFGLSSYAFAVPVCNGGATCENPGVAAQPSLIISAANILSIQSANSVGPNGNQTNSNYFFAATTSNLGPIAASPINNSGTGTTVVGVTATHPASTTPASIVGAGSINGTKGGTIYFIYAQACPAATPANGTNCSSWAKVDASALTTTAYPTVVFAAPVKPTDATLNSINVRTAVPGGDVSQVSAIDLTIDDLITPANSQTILPITYNNGTGNTVPYPVNSGAFPFIPNTKYQYDGQVQYPWDLVPIAGPETIGPFWTTPADPGPVTELSFTHCSASIKVQNAATAAPLGNPTYTNYLVCAKPAGAAVCKSPNPTIGDAPNGGPNPTDFITETVVGLTPGTVYTPNAQALVGNGDGSSAGWNPSAVTSGTGFTTLAFGGTFAIGTVTHTTAILTASAVDTTGVTAWNIVTVPAVAGLPSGTAVDLNGAHTLTGLTPNVHYSVTMHIVEASGCTADLPAPAIVFATQPFAPTAGTGTAISATSITANWTDGSANPTGSTYQVKYCTNSDLATGCATKNVAKVGGTPQTTNLTALTEETSYYIEVQTLNVDQPAGANNQDSGFFVFTNNPTETLNAAPVVPAPTCVNIGVTNTATCSVAGVVDNDLGNAVGVVYAWDLVTPVGGTSFSPASTSGSTSNSNSTTFSYAAAAPFDVRVTVTDHNGAGLATSNHVNFNPGQIPTTIEVTPAAATVATGQSTAVNFASATVRDQNGLVIAARSVNWTMTDTLNNPTPANVVNPTSGVSTTLTAGLVTGNFVLHAKIGAVEGTAAITIVSAGPIFDAFTFAMNIGDKGGTAVVASHNAAAPTSTHVFTASDPGVTFTAPIVNGSITTTGATFSKAGPVTLTDTVTDSLGGVASSSTIVNVPQDLTGIKVCAVGDASCATAITVRALQSEQFTATGSDQFGNSMLVGALVWTDGGGNVIGSGGSASFSSATLGVSVRVTATEPVSGKTGSILLSIISFDVSGAYAFPVPYKASMSPHIIYFKNLGTQAKIRIFTASGRKVFEQEVDNCPDQGHCYPWNIQNSSGENIASGVYLYVIESPEGKKDGKLIIIQ